MHSLEYHRFLLRVLVAPLLAAADRSLVVEGFFALDLAVRVFAVVAVVVVLGSGEGSRISSSSSSGSSVPGSVAVPPTLGAGVIAAASSPLSCVNALLSLSNPAKLSFVLFRPRFFPLAVVPAACSGSGVDLAEVAGEVDIRVRRARSMASMAVSGGRLYSSFGVEFFEPCGSYPSASKSIASSASRS